MIHDHSDEPATPEQLAYLAEHGVTVDTAAVLAVAQENHPVPVFVAILAEGWHGRTEEQAAAVLIVQPQQALRLGAVLTEIGERLLAPPDVRCPGCSQRLHGAIASRGACLGCFPEVPDGEVPVDG